MITAPKKDTKPKYDFIEEINITDSEKSYIKTSNDENSSLKHITIQNNKHVYRQNEQSIRKFLYKNEEELVKKLNLFTTEEKNNIFYSIRLRQSQTELNLNNKVKRNKTKDKINTSAESKTMNKTIKTIKDNKMHILNSQTPIHQKSNRNLVKFSNKFLPILEKSSSMKMIINSSLRKKECNRTILDKNLLKLKEREEEIDSHSIPDKLIKINNIKYEKDLILLKTDIESNIKSLQSKNEKKIKLIKEMNEEIKGMKLKQFILDNNEGKDLNIPNFPLYTTTHKQESKRSFKSVKTVKIVDLQNKLKRNVIISNEKSKLDDQIGFTNKILLDVKNSYDIDVNEVNSLKQQLKYIKNDLLYHYHSILYEAKDLRNEGLSWVIKSIYDLGYEVILTYIPPFLDEKCIEYIFNKAHIEIELEEIKIQIQVLKFTIRLLNKGKCTENCSSNDYNESKDIFANTKLKGSSGFSNKSIYNRIKMKIEEIIHSKNISFDSNIDNINEEDEYINDKKTYMEGGNILNEGNKIINDFQMSNINKLDSLNKQVIYNKTKKNNIDSSINMTGSSIMKKFRNVDKKKLSFITKDDIKFYINTKKVGNKSIPIEIQRRLNHINKKIIDSQEGFEYLFDEEGFSIRKLSNLMKFYEKTNINSEHVEKLNELHSLEMKEKILKKELVRIRDEEMNRIFNEFFLFNYSKRFKIEKIFLVRALVGDEDVVLRYMNDHTIKEKEYIDSMKHIKIYNNLTKEIMN